MHVILYFQPAFKSYSKPEKLAGVQEIAESANFHVQIIEDMPDADRILQLRSFWRCEGAIVECGGREQEINPKIFGDLPVVFFNRSFDTLPKRCFAVRHDSKGTGTLAARELLLANLTSLAYVRAPGNPFWSQEREQGFLDALALNGHDAVIFDWPAHTASTTERTKLLRKFLQRLVKPCAIFVANDLLAAEVVTAARMSGLTVPDDISVLGVDNSTDICEYTMPTLSSIEPDFRRGGNLAMMMLLAAIKDGNAFKGPQQRMFGDRQVVRRLSTKRLQRPDATVAEALDLIRRKACSGLKAAEVAGIFPCSRRMADLRFTQAVGHTILDEIQSVRLVRAKQLLLIPNQGLKTISDFCGFKNPNSLRKFFRKETGENLSSWRRARLLAR